MANNKTLLLVGLGAAALYFLSQRQAAAAQGAMLYPGGAMNPNGFPDQSQWWQAPAEQLIDGLIYYPFGSSPDGSPTPQSASQMAWPTSTYA